MIQFTTDNIKNGKLLAIEGKATIENNGKLQEYSDEFLKASEKAQTIEISLGKLTELDSAFLQTIQSLKNSLVEKGMSVTVPLENIQPDIRNILELSGFRRQLCGGGY